MEKVNCFNCKIINECDFGKAIQTLQEYKTEEDGVSTVVHLLNENLKQYMDCSYGVVK